MQDLEQLSHRFEERHEPRVPGDDLRSLVGQDGADVRVRHPSVAVDDAVVHLVTHDGPALVDLHHARLHQTIDVRVQAAEASRKLRREHVDRPFREVHGGAAFVGLDVQGAALGHVVRDVCDVHAQPEIPAG